MDSKENRKTYKTALEIAVERAINSAKTATREEKIESLRKAGIVDQKGNLTNPYTKSPSNMALAAG